MRTTPLLVTAWAGAATAAVGLGFFSVSLLDADPVAAAASSTTTAAPTATPAVTTPVSGVDLQMTGQQVTDGGTVYGSCVDGQAQAGSAPAAGWTVDDSSTSTSVELKAGDRRIHVTVSCTDAGPSFAVAEGGDDDTVGTTPSAGPTSSSGSSSSGGSSSSSASTAAVTPDDHGSGGHGSDDSGSDDSGGHGSGSDDSGRGSGGHGSDD